MKVLVTGGVGFIGTNLIRRLLGDGHEVVSVDNYYTGTKENEHSGCQYFDADIRITDDYSFFMKWPDVIFHLAALARIQPSFKKPTETFDTNFVGTQHILEWARKNNTPVVYAGSSSAHGDLYANPYTFTKWQGEEIVQMYNKIYGIPTSICRFYNVYGPSQLVDGPYCTVVGVFMKQYEDGKDITITWDGEQRRDFTHVYDIVDGLVRCGNALLGAGSSMVSGQIFELGTGKNYSINELAEAFEGYPTIHVPKRDGEMRNTLCADTKAHELLGWNPKEDLLEWVSSVINVKK